MSWAKQCALFVGGAYDAIIGGENLGTGSDFPISLISAKPADASSFLGVGFEFPIDSGNEAKGFGICHKVDRTTNDPIIPTAATRITLRFPRGSITPTVIPLPHFLRRRFATNKDLSLLEVSVKGPVRVDRFGMPFHNPNHPSNGWLNLNEEIVDDVAFLDILQMKKFSFVVPGLPQHTSARWCEEKLPSPFSYPYGTAHYWDEARYHEMHDDIKGPLYRAAFAYDDDNSHLAVMTQSQVQDVMWVVKAAGQIADQKLHAYFVKCPDLADAFFVIIPLTNSFKKSFDPALSRLATLGGCMLGLYKQSDKEPSARWEAKLEMSPSKIGAIAKHSLTPNDLVLYVRRPEDSKQGHGFEIRTFPDHQTANAALNESNALEEEADGTASPVSTIPEDTRYRMSLHRDLLRGNGFYETLVTHSQQLDNGVSQMSTLPSQNVFSLGSQQYVDALMEEVLEEDHDRFLTYFTNRPLGLSLITRLPSSGKPTALAIVTLGMRSSIGYMYCSAPGNAAVNKFAHRLDTLMTRVAARGSTQRLVVVRGYSIEDEIAAFQKLLENPSIGDLANPGNCWHPSPWKLHLSLAYWLLMLLRSPSVRELDTDDSPTLHFLQDKLDQMESIQRIRNVARGKITRTEYNAGAVLDEKQITALMDIVLTAADFVCTTPSQAAKQPYCAWLSRAEGIAVNEASRMTRPDLYSIWDNDLRPCVLAGEESRWPKMLTGDELDVDGNALNRHAADARISGLHFFMASGWPVYRLKSGKAETAKAEDQDEKQKAIAAWKGWWKK
ncbi:hypothetical protein PT974_08020 [Cladobotryum mycophilum]|uniref:Uncharacterized protein n=1 Tax=Cladobotryum mycophilum TaxID=491253 RepID=A0ABR0SD88_9HYPO